MPEPRTPAAILLDVDGTLVDTKRLYIECYRQAVLPYVGRELTPEEVMALRPRSELRFLRDVVGEEDLPACLEDFHRAYDRLHDEHFDGIYDGVREMLSGLRQGGFPLGIVTGKSRRSWESMRVRAELEPFDVRVFDDDVDEPKPDPQGLRLALERLGTEPDGAVYLGDSLGDVEAAVAAGVRPAAALWARKPENRASFLERLTPYEVPAFALPADFVRWVRDGSRPRHSPVPAQGQA